MLFYNIHGRLWMHKKTKKIIKMQLIKYCKNGRMQLEKLINYVRGK